MIKTGISAWTEKTLVESGWYPKGARLRALPPRDAVDRGEENLTQRRKDAKTQKGGENNEETPDDPVFLHPISALKTQRRKKAGRKGGVPG